MNLSLRKYLPILISVLLFLPFNGIGQNITGIWRGNFETFLGGDNYKFELQIEQSKTNRVSGVSYSYLDTRFYGKATLTGVFSKGTKSALIQEIKTVEVKMAGGSGGACIMKCSFIYSRSGKEEFLEGTYTSVEEGSNPPVNCGGGKVLLRKVATSDFYIEPFLRKDEPQKDSVIKKPVTKPQTKPVVKKPILKKTPVINNPKPDTVKKKTTEPVIIDKPVTKPVFNIPVVTRSRDNELAQTLTVTNEDINVRLYDNGDIDGDTISVYLDGKAVVSNKGLSTSPITIKLKMDAENPEHVLVMVAENLGRIPPNTSLMIVQDGDKRYQVSITSTEQKNAMVRFRYQKKKD